MITIYTPYIFTIYTPYIYIYHIYSIYHIYVLLANAYLIQANAFCIPGFASSMYFFLDAASFGGLLRLRMANKTNAFRIPHFAGSCCVVDVMGFALPSLPDNLHISIWFTWNRELGFNRCWLPTRSTVINRLIINRCLWLL